MQTTSQLFLNALTKLVRPLVKLALKYGITYSSFNELVNRLYVEEAAGQLQREGKRVTIAHVSVLTGINKKTAKQLMNQPDLEQNGVEESFNRSVRVISGWLRDPDFQDKKGDPESLPFDGDDLSFTELARRYSGDMSAKVLAEELLRVDAIEHTRHGDLRLTSRGFVPTGGEADKLDMLGTDVRDLIETIDHNLECDESDKRFQRKVAYIHFPRRHLAAFREHNRLLSQNLLEQLNRWLAEHDDASPDEPKTRLGVGIYQFEKEEK